MNRPEPGLPPAGGSAYRQNQLGQAIGAKGDRTRRKLLQATETLLGAMPLRDLGVAQIVRVANTSGATFYVYFNDVSEAVLALIGELTQSPPDLLSLLAEPWEGDGALDRAHEFMAAYSEHWQSHAAALRARNLACDEGDLRFSELRVNAVAPLMLAMAQRVRQRQAAGGLPAHLDPNAAAATLLAMVERIAGVRLPGGGGVTKPRLLHVAAFFAVVLLADAWRQQAPHPRQAPARPGPRDLEPAWTEAAGPSAAGRCNLHGQAMGAKGAQTRQRLVEATADLVNRGALPDLSVAEITKSARTSTSTFYLYFQDVSEALLAVTSQVSRATPEMIALLSGDWDTGDVEQRAHEFVTRYIDQWQANRDLFQARNCAAEEGDQRFVLARREAVRPLLELIARRVSECQADGRLTAELHPASAAGGFLAMIERLAVTPNINTGRVTLEAASRASAYFLSVLMGGRFRP